MAVTQTQTNNKIVKWSKDILREYVRENLFSPYVGSSLNSIIRVVNDLKAGGEQINVPLVARLTNDPIGTGTLVGNEESIDNYGFRAWIDWARNGVAINKSERQKSFTDLIDVARPLLSDWGKELQIKEICLALHALPSTSQPANLGTTNGQRVNGVLFSAADTTAKNAWVTANVDRVLFGATKSNYSTTFSTAIGNIDNTADKLTAASISLMKRIAKQANPRIRPYKLTDGREYFVLFAGSYAFRDLKTDLATVNKDARPREGNGMDKNPIFQDGDQIYDGVIVREVPAITENCTVNNGSIDTCPVFFCGQQALAWAWGQAPIPTQRKEDDYGFIKGVGVEMAYGMAKIAKIPAGGSALKDWGVLTGYFASVADS